MHGRTTVDAALACGAQGMNATEVSRQLGIPRETVRDWMAGALPSSFRGIDPCNHDFAALPAAYAYLLGLYLGDGCLSSHPRGVYKLRIVLDVKYPRIIASTAQAMREIRRGHVAIQRRLHENCVEVLAYWKCWPCLFPQHGSGRKHARPIELTEWQEQIVDRWPKQLLRGLIHSDGCRFIKTGTKWIWPRYAFSNTSTDIRRIFCEACDRLGLHYTFAKGTVVYVSRKADVAKLDTFIGPKT